MFLRRCMCGAVAALFLFTSAGAESVTTEHLVNLAPEEVLQLEKRLNELGYLASEGNQVYDAETRQALESFQQANGLAVNGQPDAATMMALYGENVVSRKDYLQRFVQSYQGMSPLRLGDVNGQVQIMQLLLGEYGYFTGSGDGVFGESTRQAVERFQMVNGLKVTGEADGMTLMRLMADVPISWQGFLAEMSCAPGDSGLNVYALQKQLGSLGYYEGECTGNYGEYTQRAVTRLQEDNGLEPSGSADTALLALIYSGSLTPLRSADALYLGDTGEGVTQLQTRLSALGYYAYDMNGSFDYATQTALRLFQMAHGLEATGIADGDTRSALMSESACRVDDPSVMERYAALLTGRTPGSQSEIADIALGMVGKAFDVHDDALYPGFALAQYVCVAAGLPILQPETLIRLADRPVESDAEITAGNIVAFQKTESDKVSMLLTVGAGDGRVIYATQDADYVVASYVSQIDSARIYRWSGPEV